MTHSKQKGMAIVWNEKLWGWKGSTSKALEVNPHSRRKIERTNILVGVTYLDLSNLKIRQWIQELRNRMDTFSIFLQGKETVFKHYVTAWPQFISDLNTISEKTPWEGFLWNELLWGKLGGESTYICHLEDKVKAINLISDKSQERLLYNRRGHWQKHSLAAS